MSGHLRILMREIIPPWLQPRIVFNHIVAAGQHVVVLQSAVVYSLVEAFAVTSRSAVIGADDDIALRDKFTANMGDGRIAGVGVDSAVGIDDKGILLSLLDIFREEDISIELELVVAERIEELDTCLGLIILGRTCDPDLVADGYILQPLVDGHLFEHPFNLVEIVGVVLLCIRGECTGYGDADRADKNAEMLHNAIIILKVRYFARR